jgi:hypothetical protein
MKRASLTAVTALGGVISIAGAAGIFAVFTDQATTGDNSVVTGERPRSADILLAMTATDPGAYPVACGVFQQDLTTPLFNVTDLRPGDAASAAICLGNEGTNPVGVSASAIDLLETETGCTGDEQAAGDSTCGQGGGEVSPVLMVTVWATDCSTGTGAGGGQDWQPPSALLGDMASSALAVTDVSPNTVACLLVTLALSGPDDLLQVAQTDRASWRFAFDAVAQPVSPSPTPSGSGGTGTQ